MNLPPPPTTNSQDSVRPLHARPPSLLLLALELRAAAEMGTLLPGWPVLARAPRGDGHPVVVFPGLSANDLTTAPLRRYIRSLGYRVRGWEQGANFGTRAGVLDKARANLARTFEETGRKVSLVGWSLGGIYARELAKEAPHMVRCVITLGTPFAGSHRSTNAWRLYQLVSGQDIETEAARYNLQAAPPVPTTSIYSRSDGIVAWQASLQQDGHAETENVEVRASHIGLGLNPAAYWIVADRLAQAEGHWTPFSRSPGNRLQQLLFPDPLRPHRGG
ncbi:MAG: alpha/beta hydrolase [Polaromonas sp.]|nr:alpha/beta hydrolase [Polaromonas sp.]